MTIGKGEMENITVVSQQSHDRWNLEMKGGPTGGEGRRVGEKREGGGGGGGGGVCGAGKGKGKGRGEKRKGGAGQGREGGQACLIWARGLSHGP